MNKIIEYELVRGIDKIALYFHNAREKWVEVSTEIGLDDVPSLAKWCTVNQNWFEQNCGGEWLGQEVMVTSGIVGLYNPHGQWNEESRRTASIVYRAIIHSQCSREVKHKAQSIAEIYRLVSD